MKMTRVMIQLPIGLKAKLDTLRRQGTSISGYIRAVLERELKHAPTGQKGR
jgi:hypothetical protein